MSHVASVCSAPIVGAARARGLDPAELTHGLDLRLEDLESPRRRIPWSSFVVFAERAAKMLGSETLEDLAATATLDFVPRPIRRVLPRLRDSRPLFRFAARFWGPWVFRGTRGHCELLPDGRILEVVRILPDHAPSPEFLAGIRGTLRAMPRLLGQPDALVTLEHDGREGEYMITPPPRVTRSEETSPRHDSLRRLGEILARGGDGDRDALHQDIVRWVAEQRGGAGVRLAAYDELGALREAVAGATVGGPFEVFPLRVAGRQIGQLELWRSSETVLPPSDDLVPWIAFAVESGRSRALVEQLAEQLIQDVRDWERVERRLTQIAAQRSGSAETAEPPVGGRASVDLAELVYGMASRLRVVTGEDVQLELSCAERLGPAYCDRRELEALVASVVGILCDIGSEEIRVEARTPVQETNVPGEPTSTEILIRGRGEALDPVSPFRFQTALELGEAGLLLTDLDLEGESEGEVGVRIRLPAQTPPDGTRLH